MTQKKKETGEKTAKRVAVGTAYGMLGMVSFSVTLPATRAAVLYFHPSVVALFLPVVAAAFVAVLLITTKSRFPPRQHWKSFVLIVLGVVIGVPITFAWGMHSLPAAHGAITLALLPLTTALFAKLRTGEHPSKRFWGASLAGSASVVAFAVAHGAGAMRMGDAVLFLSVIASSLGYAEGMHALDPSDAWLGSDELVAGDGRSFHDYPRAGGGTDLWHERPGKCLVRARICLPCQPVARYVCVV